MRNYGQGQASTSNGRAKKTREKMKKKVYEEEKEIRKRGGAERTISQAKGYPIKFQQLEGRK